MTKEQREHLEQLKKNAIVVVAEEVVYINKKKKIKRTFSDGKEVYYNAPHTPCNVVACGTGCRSGIPFNPINTSSTHNPEFTWERDSVYEQISEVEE